MSSPLLLVAVARGDGGRGAARFAGRRGVWLQVGARRAGVQPGAPDPEDGGAADDALKSRLCFFLANPTSREGPKSMLLGISGWSSRGEDCLLREASGL